MCLLAVDSSVIASAQLSSAEGLFMEPNIFSSLHQSKRCRTALVLSSGYSKTGTVIERLNHMSSIKLKSFSNRDIVGCSVTGYELRAASDTALLLTLEYVETIEQLETGGRKTFQAILTSQQALELSESLKESATLMLRPGYQPQVN